MDLMELNSTNITALVTGLTPFTFYTLHVLAVTVAHSEASESVTVRTNEAGNHQTSLIGNCNNKNVFGYYSPKCSSKCYSI